MKLLQLEGKREQQPFWSSLSRPTNHWKAWFALNQANAVRNVHPAKKWGSLKGKHFQKDKAPHQTSFSIKKNDSHNEQPLFVKGMTSNKTNNSHWKEWIPLKRAASTQRNGFH